MVEGFKNVPLRERIRDEIARMILSGELPRGALLDERILSQQLAVSRTPFREALGVLAQEGLIETRPYRGTFVRDFTAREVIELYGVRRVLEGEAVRLAVPLMTTSDIDDIAAMLDDAVAALRRDDMEAYAFYDRKFHDAFVTISGNRILKDHLARLSLQIQACRVFANQRPGLAEQTAVERTAILKALRASQAGKAAALMEQHILSVQRSIEERLVSTTLS